MGDGVSEGLGYWRAIELMMYVVVFTPEIGERFYQSRETRLGQVALERGMGI